MLIYASSFWFELAGGPSEIIHLISKRVGGLVTSATLEFLKVT